ncbi:hypothetical protein ACFVUS_33460 [Nocardia sp. NPDC058058]|uniref:hypothetical protein n=1 Tax=Nocardia sp. NPDC058058 TaxID=3346317 RepID=UPI0036DD43D7
MTDEQPEASMWSSAGRTEAAARVLALCAPLLLTGACGGHSESSAPASEVDAVTTTFEHFFDSSLPVDQKMALVENGPAFAETLRAQANSSIAGGASASVSQVDSTGPDRAAVTYTIKKHGFPLLPNRHGEAIRTDGSWKVTAQTFCSLLQLERSAPPVCDNPAPTK